MHQDEFPHDDRIAAWAARFSAYNMHVETVTIGPEDVRRLKAQYERVPTSDEVMGTARWNNLTEQERARCMQEAGNTGVAAVAWAVFKKHSSPE